MHDGQPGSSARRGGRPAERRPRVSGLMGGAMLAAGLFFAGSCGVVTAQVMVEEAPVRHVTLTLNKAKTLTFNTPFATAAVGSPEIAQLLPMTDRKLYVQGKQVGTTSISVFDADKRLVSVLDVEVVPDTVALQSKISAKVGAGAISVSSVNGNVLLSGEASDAVSAARAVDMAKGLARDPKGNETPIVNAMQVRASQQVMLKVRFLEVDRTAGRDLGVNFFGGNKNGIGVSGLGAVSQSPTAVAGSITGTSSTGAQTSASIASQTIGVSGPTITGSAGGADLTGTVVPLLSGLFAGGAASATPFGALLARVININGVNINALVSALEEKGLVKTLAEPDLVAQSGKKAAFFAGAQVPIPTVQPGTIGGTPTVTVNYYPCGVTLNFIPTVLTTGLINVELGPQVCQVSSTTSVVVNGTQIPELNTRSADTTVELRDGQSFAVAGLLQAQDVNQLSQLPWIGNVPVLGALFRSTNYQKSETDLLVIVTVHLVRPVAAGKHLVTPFDTTLPANDADLFLMGDTERKKKYTQFVTSGGNMQGPYGHVLEAK